MFKENRLIYNFKSGQPGGNADDLMAKAEKIVESAEKVPFNPEKLDQYIDHKISRISIKKAEDFAKNMSKGSSAETNKKFCKDVLDVSENVLGKYSDKQIAVVIKGFQEHINTQFPKSKITTDGKVGKKTMDSLISFLAVNYGPETTQELFTDIKSSFSFVNNENLAKCGKISNWKQANLFFWNNVLDLDFPEEKKQNQLTDKDKNYIQSRIKYLQKYISAKLGINLKADGKIGPKTLSQFAKMIKPAQEEQQKADKEQKAKEKRLADFAGTDEEKPKPKAKNRFRDIAL